MTHGWEVVIAPQIEDEVRAILAWWREHRPASPDLLQRELDDALQLLVRWPGAGEQARLRGREVHRVVLRRTGYLVYYGVEARARRVTVLRVRNGRRRPIRGVRRAR